MDRRQSWHPDDPSPLTRGDGSTILYRLHTMGEQVQTVLDTVQSLDERVGIQNGRVFTNAQNIGALQGEVARVKDRLGLYRSGTVAVGTAAGAVAGAVLANFAMVKAVVVAVVAVLTGGGR